MILMIDFPPYGLPNLQKESAPEITKRNKNKSIQKRYKELMKID